MPFNAIKVDILTSSCQLFNHFKQVTIKIECIIFVQM